MKAKDKNRKWVVYFLIVLILTQSYVVKELFIAFMAFMFLFWIGALGVTMFYLGQKFWEALIDKFVMRGEG